jgi:hypothetical protein
MARYQSIIDVLMDDKSFERVYFDREPELPIPYRRIGFLKRNALQEKPGKGRDLHKKWADICAIRSGRVKVIVEEERKKTVSEVETVIEKVAKCRYLWVDGKLFPFDTECSLFIVMNDNIYNVQERVDRNVGNLKRVIVCSKESFREKYTKLAKPGSGGQGKGWIKIISRLRALIGRISISDVLQRLFGRK